MGGRETGPNRAGGEQPEPWDGRQGGGGPFSCRGGSEAVHQS